MKNTIKIFKVYSFQYGWTSIRKTYTFNSICCLLNRPIINQNKYLIQKHYLWILPENCEILSININKRFMCLLENMRKQDLLLTLLYTILATFSHLTLMLYYSITTIFKCLDILSTIQLEGLIAKNSAPGDHKYYEFL